MRMNNRERELWVLNDEGLYLWAQRWMRTHKGGMRGFIRAHRDEIDAHMKRVLDSANRKLQGVGR